MVLHKTTVEVRIYEASELIYGCLSMISFFVFEQNAILFIEIKTQKL